RPAPGPSKNGRGPFAGAPAGHSACLTRLEREGGQLLSVSVVLRRALNRQTVVDGEVLLAVHLVGHHAAVDLGRRLPRPERTLACLGVVRRARAAPRLVRRREVRRRAARAVGPGREDGKVAGGDRCAAIAASRPRPLAVAVVHTADEHPVLVGGTPEEALP